MIHRGTQNLLLRLAQASGQRMLPHLSTLDDSVTKVNDMGPLSSIKAVPAVYRRPKGIALLKLVQDLAAASDQFKGLMASMGNLDPKASFNEIDPKMLATLWRASTLSLPSTSRRLLVVKTCTSSLPSACMHSSASAHVHPDKQSQ